VVSNLLANALRFATSRGAARCTLRADGEHAVLEVADSGVGIAPERRELLFERFSTAGDDGKKSGTGLGLAIVKEFVALHGGTVTVGDAPEGGALFSVRLPREPAHSEPAPVRLSQQLAAARRVRYVKEHLAAELAGNAPMAPAELDLPSVLLVDLDRERTTRLADALEGRAGVFTAGEATEALRLATDLQPDMVVIGSLDGGGTATALLDRMAREWRLLGVLRVALVDRGGDPAVRSRLQEAGAQDFIAEPLAREELRARFGLLLEHASLRRRAEAAEAELRRLRHGAGVMPLAEAPSHRDGAPNDTATRSDRRSERP
jgi:CheY-like chemotaxis protein